VHGLTGHRDPSEGGFLRTSVSKHTHIVRALHATRPQVRLVACTRMWIYPVVHSLILKWPSGRANPGTHVHVLQTHVTIMR